jgi:hypothetical protein
VPLTLPNLDDVTWQQLTEEARSLIPAYAPEWTNHNPSDPGITLVEVFAFYSELLLYRLNRIGDQQTKHFLQLLNGPAWIPSKSLDEEKRATVTALREQLRAVTAADFEALAIATTQHAASLRGEHVARAKCISERNLENDDTAADGSAAPGHISVIVVPHRHHPPSKALLRTVKDALHSAKLLTTQVHVVPPRFVTFGIRVTLIPRRDASVDWVHTAALNRLKDFYDPLSGGFDEKGWSFGRNVYVSEVYQILSKIPGVDYVSRSKNPKAGEEMDELFVGPAELDRLKFNSLNELEAMEVRDGELVALSMSPDDVTIDTKRAGR